MGIEERLEEVQNKVERRFSNIGKGKYARIIKIAKKPTESEYIKVLLITGAGILFLGFMGFFIYLLMSIWPN